MSDLVKRARGTAEYLGADINDAFRHEADLIDEMADEIERLREALVTAEHGLEKIQFATGSMPEAMQDEAAWYRMQFYDCVATASNTLTRVSEMARHE